MLRRLSDKPRPLSSLSPLTSLSPCTHSHRHGRTHNACMQTYNTCRHTTHHTKRKRKAAGGHQQQVRRHLPLFGDGTDTGTGRAGRHAHADADGLHGLNFGRRGRLSQTPGARSVAGPHRAHRVRWGHFGAQFLIGMWAPCALPSPIVRVRRGVMPPRGKLGKRPA